jgi:hypothetical protein
MTSSFRKPYLAEFDEWRFELQEILQQTSVILKLFEFSGSKTHPSYLMASSLSSSKCHFACDLAFPGDMTTSSEMIWVMLEFEGPCARDETWVA